MMVGGWLVYVRRRRGRVRCESREGERVSQQLAKTSLPIPISLKAEIHLDERTSVLHLDILVEKYRCNNKVSRRSQIPFYTRFIYGEVVEKLDNVVFVVIFPPFASKAADGQA